MSGNFQQTHEKLLACAKRHFLENGFERASIREICKDAHVTNGAFYNHFADKEAMFGELVEPVVQTIAAMYDTSVAQHYTLAESDDLRKLWTLSEQTLSTIIEYIYDHFDVFELLLMRSTGTRYASFLDDVVRLEVAETHNFLAQLKVQGIVFNTLEDDEWHMLIHSYYSSIAEIVMHHYPKEAALKYTHTLATFFSAGWYSVLGI